METKYNAERGGRIVGGAVIHNFINKIHTKKLNFNIVLLYPVANSRITLKCVFFHQRTSNAAAEVFGLA